MKVKYSKQFRKDIKRLSNKEIQQFKHRFELFLAQPTHPTLNNHKLKGRLKSHCSFNVTGDIRVQYQIEEKKSGTIIKFDRIGPHSQLY